MTDRPVLVWFRRDLRLHDHPALTHALDDAACVVPVFVLDDALLAGRSASANRNWFLQGALRSLHDDLAARGAGLVVRAGHPADVLTTLAAEVGADTVYTTRDVTPYARRRDRSVADAGLTLRGGRGGFVHDPEDVRTNAGGTYTVFTPYRKRWESLERRPVLAAPAEVPTPTGLATGVPQFAGAPEAPVDALPQPGEAAARERLARWATSAAAARYDTGRDVLGADGTSRLGADLRFGLLSPVEVVDTVTRAASDDDARRAVSVFVSELCWRDFYAQVLWHHPHAATRAFKERYDAVAWRDDPELFAAWSGARTGYPVVDAAMRQLVATGWMHNRARMIVASFLTKDLLVDWRLGEAFFMRHLVDGDPASNNGGWQWAASTGTDAQPWFRIFNPVTQGKRFDPDGDYVRRWLPELARVPIRRLHEPWTMTADEQAAAGCTIGVDYPAPVVDHAIARQATLDAFSAVSDRT